MLAVTIAGTAATIGLYRPEVCLDRRRFLLCGTIAALLAFPAILLVSGAYRMTLSGEHVVWLARLLAIWLPFVLLVRFGLSAVAARMPVTRRVLIVGNGDAGNAAAAAADGETPRPVRADRANGRRRNSMVKPPAMPVSNSPVPTPVGTSGPDRAGGLSARLVREWRVWGIVIAEDAPAPHTHDALLDNKLRGIPVYSDLSFQEQHLGRIDLDAIDSNWLLFADGFQNGAVSRAVKRCFDIAVGLLLTIVTLPLMLVTAAAIKLDSRGPVFYRQERTGLHGGTFTLFKFRSMANNAEAAGKPQWAQQEGSADHPGRRLHPGQPDR